MEELLQQIIKSFEKIKLLRNVGSKQKYEHEIIGYNSRPQPLLGIVLNEKLKNLHEWNRIMNTKLNFMIFKIIKKFISIFYSNDK